MLEQDLEAQQGVEAAAPITAGHHLRLDACWDIRPLTSSSSFAPVPCAEPQGFTHFCSSRRRRKRQPRLRFIARRQTEKKDGAQFLSRRRGVARRMSRESRR